MQVSSKAPVSLSLVIPLYNRIHLLAETLDRALGQSSPFAEIVLLDDGSSEDVRPVIAPYGDRIRYIRTENGGVQAARNRGVAAAASEYVTLCDSDDLLQANFVETIATWLAENPLCDIVYSNFATFSNNKVNADKFSYAPPGYFDGGKTDGDFVSDIPDLYARTMAYQPLFPTGSTFKKSFYEKIGGYNTAFNGIGPEDWEFLLRAIAMGKVAVCRQALTLVRKHDENFSADTLKQTVGEVYILEYVLANHAAASAYRPLILATIQQRRVDAFESAFARGDFEVASTLLSHLQETPAGLKFQIKKTITALPPLLRKAAWQATQR